MLHNSVHKPRLNPGFRICETLILHFSCRCHSSPHYHPAHSASEQIRNNERLWKLKPKLSTLKVQKTPVCSSMYVRLSVLLYSGFPIIHEESGCRCVERHKAAKALERIAPNAHCHTTCNSGTIAAYPYALPSYMNLYLMCFPTLLLHHVGGLPFPRLP
ncbi:hypothetical protein BJ508DRAFT_174317 [Ascobolus immersus RN42]|uniref:Uncharacterized protein n=1 Tax=Ascobolus immersus RN42 TaxID=1160509 RepID=A0A3N4HV88_ASCIM|nr:hypothetical protein BJ508DRAFT_174317 [Ascobolus immersus RN42]